MCKHSGFSFYKFLKPFFCSPSVTSETLIFTHCPFHKSSVKTLHCILYCRFTVCCKAIKHPLTIGFIFLAIISILHPVILCNSIWVKKFLQRISHESFFFVSLRRNQFPVRIFPTLGRKRTWAKNLLSFLALRIRGIVCHFVLAQGKKWRFL